MKLSKITNKQAEILQLIYTYRFLNRIQIQTLMHHKDKKTINVWLKDLTEKEYITRIYSDHFLEKTKPAVYYLSLNGIRRLKTLTKEVKDEDTGSTEIIQVYEIEELRKRYREHERSQGFIDRSILIAQCCIDLEIKVNLKASGLVHDTYTEAEYRDEECGYHFLSEYETLLPNLCIIKNPSGTRTNYLLEIFDSTLPRYRLKKRIKDYINYLIDDDWESGDNDPPPIILLAIPNLVDLIYGKRLTKKLLLDEYDEVEDIPEDLHIRFATTEQLKINGVTAKIWEEQRELYNL